MDLLEAMVAVAREVQIGIGDDMVIVGKTSFRGKPAVEVEVRTTKSVTITPGDFPIIVKKMKQKIKPPRVRAVRVP